MQHKTYRELLKDPRWQKKRLEVMEDRHFSCWSCGDTKSTLHVHHGAYLKNTMPWDYPSEMLHCLCEECHVQAEKVLEQFRRSYGMLGADYIECLVNIIEGYFDPLSRPKLSRAVCAFCEMLGLDERIIVPIAELMRRNMVSTCESEEH